MRPIEGFIWEDWVVDKLNWKHHVDPEEVEEAFFVLFRKFRKGENEKYLLFGRSSNGRYLFVVFVWVGKHVKVISARDMIPAERRYFGK